MPSAANALERAGGIGRVRMYVGLGLCYEKGRREAVTTRTRMGWDRNKGNATQYYVRR